MWGMDSYVVFDFETTGLDPRRDRIIQVGVCEVRAGVVVSTDGWLVRQDVPISAEAAAVHGIRDQALLARGIPPLESLERLLAVMDRAPACVGHNIHMFDVPFLMAEVRRFRLVPPSVEEFVDTAALFKGWRLGVSKRPTETHRAYAERVLSMRTPGLKYAIPACCRELRIDKNAAKAHDAVGDAYLTHLIYVKLLSLLTGKP
jgi:DNA polymerase-3 subunit epsilon